MQWSTGVSLPSPRAGFATAVIDNVITIMGGEDFGYTYSTIYLAMDPHVKQLGRKGNWVGQAKKLLCGSFGGRKIRSGLYINNGYYNKQHAPV